VSAPTKPKLTPLPSAPASSRRYQSVGYRTKTLLLGPALKTSQLIHQRVSKRVALAVFSSDPISSTAYATEEILLVLVGAGTSLAALRLATGLALPVALAITALHIAVDPDHARELAQLWSKVHIPIPLEIIDAPDRNLLATVEETIAELVRPDTEVTVLVPRRRYVGFWRRVLHDQTSSGLTKVLGSMENVNVTLVPFHFGSISQLRSIR
jgi:hypothetical protein